jgi:hypothetical protein
MGEPDRRDISAVALESVAFSPTQRDGEATSIRGCSARTANPSVGRVGAAVVAQGTFCPGLDDAPVCCGQLGLNGTGDARRASFR